MTRDGRCARRGRTLVLCLAGAVLLAASAGAEVRERPGDGRTSALVVFVSYDGTAPLALGATGMRLSGSRILARSLQSLGYRVVAYPDVEPVMRRWRVRSDRDVDAGFLGDLVSEFAVDRLTVIRLDVYADRVVVLARAMAAGSGSVVAAEVIEEPCGDLWKDAEAAPANWNAAVERAGRRLAERWREFVPASAPTLAVLPVKAVGVAPGHADIAAFCLVRSLLEQGAWSLPDPSLVQTGMLEAGFRPRPLTAEAREDLRSRFSAAAVLAPDLVSFGLAAPRNEGVEDRGAGPGVPSQLETRIPVLLTLVLVDTGSGRVLAGDGAYLKPESPEGLFGVVRHIRASGRLEKGTQSLVAGILPEKGEQER